SGHIWSAHTAATTAKTCRCWPTAPRPRSSPGDAAGGRLARGRTGPSMKDGKVVLALDGMGGDHAPDVVVNGADIARERYPDTSYLLFGDPDPPEQLGDKRHRRG